MTECLLVSYTIKHLTKDFSIKLQLTLHKENNVSTVILSDIHESSTDHQICELKKEKLQEIFGENADFLPQNGHNGWRQQ